MCQEFHLKNDFKLNLLRSFFSDHMTRHFIGLQDCISGSAVTSQSSHEDKDRAFLACQAKWIDNLKNNVSQEMELKARKLLGDSTSQL